MLSEDVILKWYNESHSSKGKSVFLDQMKHFVHWLQNAEEEGICLVIWLICRQLSFKLIDLWAAVNQFDLLVSSCQLIWLIWGSCQSIWFGAAVNQFDWLGHLSTNFIWGSCQSMIDLGQLSIWFEADGNLIWGSLSIGLINFGAAVIQWLFWGSGQSMIDSGLLSINLIWGSCQWISYMCLDCMHLSIVKSVHTFVRLDKCFTTNTDNCYTIDTDNCYTIDTDNSYTSDR